MIDVPKNRLGEGIYATQDERSQISEAIKKGILDAVSEIFENRDIIFRKANASLKRIQDEHSLEKFSQTLAKIYNQEL